MSRKTDLTPQEAVTLARILFPRAYQVLAYSRQRQECHTQAGVQAVKALPARVYVRLSRPPDKGVSFNNPEGIGPTLRAAVRGLARSIAAQGADRLRVLDEVGCGGPGAVRYRMEIGPHYVVENE